MQQRARRFVFYYRTPRARSGEAQVHLSAIAAGLGRGRTALVRRLRAHDGEATRGRRAEALARARGRRAS